MQHFVVLEKALQLEEVLQAVPADQLQAEVVLRLLLLELELLQGLLALQDCA